MGESVEQGDIEQVRFVGIDGRGLCLGDLRREQGFLNRVGVDAVVDLGEGALEVPLQPQAGSCLDKGNSVFLLISCRLILVPLELYYSTLHRNAERSP